MVEVIDTKQEIKELIKKFNEFIKGNCELSPFELALLGSYLPKFLANSNNEVKIQVLKKVYGVIASLQNSDFHLAETTFRQTIDYLFSNDELKNLSKKQLREVFSICEAFLKKGESLGTGIKLAAFYQRLIYFLFLNKEYEYVRRLAEQFSRSHQIWFPIVFQGNYEIHTISPIAVREEKDKWSDENIYYYSIIATFKAYREKREHIQIIKLLLKSQQDLYSYLKRIRDEKYWYEIRQTLLKLSNKNEPFVSYCDNYLLGKRLLEQFCEEENPFLAYFINDELPEPVRLSISEIIKLKSASILFEDKKNQKKIEIKCFALETVLEYKKYEMNDFVDLIIEQRMKNSEKTLLSSFELVANELISYMEFDDKKSGKKEYFNISRTKFFHLIDNINGLSVPISQKPIFNDYMQRFHDLDTLFNPAKSIDAMKSFSNSLYRFVYESSSNLNNIPNCFRIAPSFKDIKENSIFIDIKRLRTYWDHIKNSSDQAELRKISAIIKKYSGKKSIFSLSKKELVEMQEKILDELIKSLKEISEYLEKEDLEQDPSKYEQVS